MTPTMPVDLPVIAKAYDFLIWTSRHVARFPRLHRFNVGERMERHLYGILEGLLRAKFTRDRVPLLRQVNLDLEVLRFQFRAAKDLKCLPIESYGHAAGVVNEIGQMVGGWLKSSRGPSA
ncbi:MAG: diversity-generating retroelement protein Avd [Planctomycetes bacterium]|nr:diversity-generating retroelement protein Avd [Planctomycetota bacterium]